MNPVAVRRDSVTFEANRAKIFSPVARVSALAVEGGGLGSDGGWKSIGGRERFAPSLNARTRLVLGKVAG